MSLLTDSQLPAFTVENESLRLADFLRTKLRLSPSHIGRCLQNEWISVNQRIRTHKSTLLTTGDQVAVYATPFQIAQVRFAEPLLRTMHHQQGSSSYTILWKPAGMPIRGNDSATVEKALPASMQDEHYTVIDCVGRIASGPVLVYMSQARIDLCDDTSRLSLIKVTKRFTFQLLVHGTPLESLDMAGILSVQILQTTATTTGDLSHVQIVMSHNGQGLRGCLLRQGCPILGTSIRTKSNKNGCFVACTRIELLWKQNAIVVDTEVPEKFRTTLEREQRFYESKYQKEAEQEQHQVILRRDFVDQIGETSEDLLSNQWSVSTFCGLSFYVTVDVMAPKPNSEVLVLSAREYLPSTEATVLDLGTGSGCLLVSTLVSAGQSVRGVGVDISTEALRVAEINITFHSLSERVTLLQGDFNDLSFLGTTSAFDVVLCNPPYLTNGECKKDGLIGPRVALVAERRGLACYEMVANQVEDFITPNGILVLEVGGKRNVDEICRIFGHMDHIETRFDNQGRGRCLILRRCIPLASSSPMLDTRSNH